MPWKSRLKENERLDVYAASFDRLKGTLVTSSCSFLKTKTNFKVTYPLDFTRLGSALQAVRGSTSLVCRDSAFAGVLSAFGRRAGAVGTIVCWRRASRTGWKRSRLRRRQDKGGAASREGGSLGGEHSASDTQWWRKAMGPRPLRPSR